VRLNVESDCLIWTGRQLQILHVEMWKARGPNDWLCHGIESREVEDERVDFISANE